MKIRHQLFGLIFLFVTATTSAQNFDVNTVRSINQNESSFKNSYSDFCSASVNPLGVGAPVVTFAAGLITKDKQLQRDGICMAGAFIISSVVVQGTKRIVNRDRPYVTYPDIIKRSAGGGGSFPSGHTSLAFCTATSLSIHYPKWYVIAPSYLLAASTGWARMYEGVHYPSDVFVGALVGSGSAWLSYYFQKKIEKRNKNKSKSVNL